MSREASDLRRDSVELVLDRYTYEITDVRLDDVPSADDVQLIGDREEDGRWVGWYQVDSNMEKIYEVSYTYATSKFYISSYLMTSCRNVEAPYSE